MNHDQNITSGGQNKEMEQLRKEFSALSSTVQRSLEVITARLENQEPTRRDVTEQRSFMRERSSSVPGPYSSRSACDELNNHASNDCYSGPPMYRGRSVSPYNRSGDNN